MLRFEEISLHNKGGDCWVIINAKVYNVTNFLSDHPGGEEVLLAAAGKDASEEFENAGHGSAARLMLDEFYVAEVDERTIPPKKLDVPTERPQENHVEPSKHITKLLVFILPLAILVFATGMKIFSSQLDNEQSLDASFCTVLWS